MSSNLPPRFLVFCCLVLGSAGCTAPEAREEPTGFAPELSTIRVDLPSGATEVDLYRPRTAAPAPLVIVAHGFMRGRRNMAGWGRHLAELGFVAAVPDLPAWSDHARNGRFLSELREQLRTDPSIDPARFALMGFSAGGLSSLLCAAETPDLRIWVGLDPVDRDGLGAAAAPRVRCPTLVLTADPSSWNGDGNAGSIAAALPDCRHVHIPNSVHVDAEWPTDFLAEALCGRSTESARESFHEHATRALQLALTSAPGPGNRTE